MPIFNELNKLVIYDDFMRDDSFRLIAAMHSTIASRGYQDLILDFSDCKRAFSPEMLAICSRCLSYWKEGIDINLVLPNETHLKRLFINANWAHLIDFRKFEPSRFRGYTHAPAIRFSSAREQASAVDKILDILLAAISHFRRDEVRYMEWAINEITDNVINHAQSDVGGIVQVTNHRQREQIELVVSDSGVGIPATLRPANPDLQTDAEALDAAIKEGVTRDKSFGQGNGLYGSWRICQKTDGDFRIFSGFGQLLSNKKEGLRISNMQIPFNGTLVASRIGYSDRFDLSDALIFSGRRHVPVDYIETHFEEDEAGNITFLLKNEAAGYGSRSAGEPVRRKLVNVIGCLNDGHVIVDLDNVHLVSSSFADEVFGKLFTEIGPISFMNTIKFVNVDPLVKDLVDRAILQRSQQVE